MKPTNLQEHPEGGRFKEVFRSKDEVTTEDSRKRAALTHIYFALKKGEVSKFHRVNADEVWNLYRGSLDIILWEGNENPPVHIELSQAADQFCQVVEAGVWQAARPVSEEVLVGCSVGPGFDFTDFALMDENSEIATRLLALDPTLSQFI